MQICKVTRALVALSLIVCASCVYSGGQTVGRATTPPAVESQKQSPTEPAPNPNKDQGKPATDAGGGSSSNGTNSNDQVTKSDLQSTIEAALKKQSTVSDFAFQLGIGSLVRNGSATDYVDNANTLSSTSLGWATPQYLVGLAMRAPFPNFKPHGTGCTGVDAAPLSSDNGNAPAGGSQTAANGGDQNASAAGGKGAKVNKARKKDSRSTDGKNGQNSTGDKGNTTSQSNACPLWRQRPWSGFISLKFAPNSSQTINGYVLGGSYSLTSHLDLLLGFALTPVNEPSPGLRNAAYNYVIQQQKQGNDMQFNPEAMLNNSQNAFDGFSLLDSTGKLIYAGTPLEIDYRGGVVIGVSIPLSFSSFFKNPQP